MSTYSTKRPADQWEPRGKGTTGKKTTKRPQNERETKEQGARRPPRTKTGHSSSGGRSRDAAVCPPEDLVGRAQTHETKRNTTRQPGIGNHPHPNPATQRESTPKTLASHGRKLPNCTSREGTPVRKRPQTPLTPEGLTAMKTSSATKRFPSSAALGRSPRSSVCVLCTCR